MSVETLRTAIAERTKQLLASKLENFGLIYHKKHWRDCPCTWCAKKREATVVVGATRGWHNGVTVFAVDGREPVRRRYRRELAALEGDE